MWRKTNESDLQFAGSVGNQAQTVIAEDDAGQQVAKDCPEAKPLEGKDKDEGGAKQHRTVAHEVRRVFYVFHGVWRRMLRAPR